MKDKKSKAISKKSRKKEKKSPLGKALNALMPYILSVLAAIVLFSLSGLAGTVGDIIRLGLYGIFANFATYFLPIFLLYHAIMWNYDIKRGICPRRVVCTVITLMCFSTMQYLIEVGNYEKLNTYNVLAFFNLGKQSHGGGIIGGVIGKLLLGLGGTVGVIIITFILVFLILQMFNITPAYMVRSMFKSKKPTSKKVVAPKPQPAPKKEIVYQERKEKIKPIKPSKIEVFEDEDDSVSLSTNPYIDISTINASDDTDGYEALDVDSINAKVEYIPSQFQPYVEEDTPTFEIKTTRYEDTTVIKAPVEEELESAPSDYKDDVYEPVNEEKAEFIKSINEELDEINIFEDEEASMEDTYSAYVPKELLNKAASTVAPAPTPAVKTSLTVDKPKVEAKKEVKKEPKPKIDYKLPELYLLHSQPDISDSEEVKRELQENAKIIVETLAEFKARTRIVDITRGPTITRYELVPEAGVRVRTIEGLVDDIAVKLGSKGIRIECPIPGKNAIGIEVPNRKISFVYLKDLINDDKFRNAKSKLTCALGKSISGEHIYADIEATPHLLVAGATGMGKSVCINSLLISLLYNATPDDVRLILIDPKRVELSNYNGIPHLLVPVVCEPKKSLGALQWAVTEMENRFITIEEAGVRNIHEFNARVEKGYGAEKMARIVIVIDELADLKMAVPDIEESITRLTQKARAAGIHVIIGTQRPSVDVLTGLIKNNIPSRIAFRVPSQVDSRTILDEVGAEKLVSKGDMLVKLVGALAPVRVQGAFVSVDEIQDVIDFWKDSAPANYDEEVMHQIDTNAAKLERSEKEYDDGEGKDAGDFDPEFYKALDLATDEGEISSSRLMRKLSIGFQRAARIIDQMEECGYISEANGQKKRDVLITREDFMELMLRRTDTTD